MKKPAGARDRAGRKALSLALSAALMVGMVPPAFAAGADAENATTPAPRAAAATQTDIPVGSRISLQSDVLQFTSNDRFGSIKMMQNLDANIMRTADLQRLDSLTMSRTVDIHAVVNLAGTTVYCNGVTAVTGADGAADLSNVPLYAGKDNMLYAYKTGTGAGRASVPASFTGGNINIASLGSLNREKAPVVGVVTASGVAVDGASILDMSTGDIVATQADGSYTLNSPITGGVTGGSGPQNRLIVLKDGYFPGVVPCNILGTGYTYQYQYSSSNRLMGITATARESGDAAHPDPADPGHWQTPTAAFSGGGNYTTSTVINNADNLGGSTAGNAILFDSVTRMYTEDRLNNNTGAAVPDGQPDVYGVVGTASGNSNLTLEARVYLSKNTVTGSMDMIRMTVAATNTSNTAAQVFGFGWGVDLWSGTSDAANFQGPGIKEFSTDTVSPQFPLNYNKGLEFNRMLTSMLFTDPDDTSYDDKLPRYLYGVDPGSAFVSTIYPQVSSDIAYPGAKFEAPEYWGMAQYGSCADNYAFTTNGRATGSDSGFLIRYDPTLVLPGETKYYGFDYGQGQVGQAFTGRPYLQVDMAETELRKNASETAYDNQVTMNALYANDTDQVYNGAYLTLSMDKTYLEPDASMTVPGGWVLDGTAGNVQTWKLNIGNLNVNASGTSVRPPVVLSGKPVYEDADPGDSFDGAKTEIELKLHVPGYTDPQQPDPVYLKDTREVSLPTLMAVSVNGYAWQDINGNGSFDTNFEGRKDQGVRLATNPPATVAEAVSVPGGRVIGPMPSSGLVAGQDYYLWAVQEDGSPYIATIEYVSVNGVSVLGTTPGADSPLELLELTQVDGKPALHFKIKTGAVAKIEYRIQLEKKAVLEMKPHLQGSSTFIPGGTLAMNYGQGPVSLDTSAAPIKGLAPAGSNVTVTYDVPAGYRALDGTIRIQNTINNVVAWDPGAQVNNVDLPLLAGDVRLTGVTNPGGVTVNDTLGQAGPGSGESSEVAVDTTWSGQTAKLEFRAWGAGGEVTAPARTDYTWTIVSDPNGVLTGIDNQGSVTFDPAKTGDVVVQVAVKATPQIFHKMKITVGTATPPVVTGALYLADPGDLDTPLQFETLAVNTTADVVVVSKANASSAPEKLRNNAATITLAGSSMTAVPKTGDLYAFTLTGVTTGVEYATPNASGVAGSVTQYLVTNLPVTDATRLEITPDPVAVEAGATTTPTYTLRFNASSADDQQIPGEALHLSTANAAVASVDNDGIVTGTAAGDTTLSASLKANSRVSDTAPVNVGPAGGTGTGAKLLLTEVTSTGGFLDLNGTANYEVKFAADGNAATATAVPYENVTFTNDGKISNQKGGANIVTVTGTALGVTKLKAEYRLNGTTYTASVDLLVHTAGATGALELTPEYSVMNTGETKVYSVKAVYSASESYDLPGSMFTMTSATSSSSPSDNLVVDPLQKNKVRAPAYGADSGTDASRRNYISTLTASSLIGNDTAKVLVLFPGTKFRTEPATLWIAKGASGTVTATMVTNGTPATPAGLDLRPYLTATMTDPQIASTADGGAVNQYSVTGLKIGRSTLTITPQGRNDLAMTTAVYVYNGTASAIGFRPDTLNLASGASGTTQVFLAKEDGTLSDYAVDISQLQIDGYDPNIADWRPTTGTILPVVAWSVQVDSSTTFHAQIRGIATPQASLTVNVAGAATGEGGQGIKAQPNIVELWPGRTASVEVLDVATNRSLTETALNTLASSYTAAGVNSYTVESGKLKLSQDTATAGVNTLTLTLNGQRTTVYIINHTQDPTAPGSERKLALVPDPLTLIKGGAAVDVKAHLQLVTGNTVVDDIVLPPQLVSSRFNTASSYSGQILKADPAAPGSTLAVKGAQVGVAKYQVTYLGDVTVKGDGTAFVLEKAIGTGTTFKFFPDNINLRPGQVSAVEGKITWADGTEQIIRGMDLPVAVPDLASAGTTIASVTAAGVITAVAVGDTQVTGTLAGTALNASTQVSVRENAGGASSLTLRVEPTVVITNVGATKTLKVYVDNSEDGSSTLVTSSILQRDYLLNIGQGAFATAYPGGTTNSLNLTGLTDGLDTLTITSRTDARLTATVNVLVQDTTNYTYELYVNPRIMSVGSTAFLDGVNDAKNVIVPEAKLRRIDRATGAAIYITIPASMLTINFAGQTFYGVDGTVIADPDRPTFDQATGEVRGGGSLGQQAVSIKLGSMAPTNSGGGNKIIVYGNESPDTTFRVVDTYQGNTRLTDEEAAAGPGVSQIVYHGDTDVYCAIDDNDNDPSTGTAGWYPNGGLTTMGVLDNADPDRTEPYHIMWVPSDFRIWMDQPGIRPGGSGPWTAMVDPATDTVVSTDGETEIISKSSFGYYGNFPNNMIMEYTAIVMESGQQVTVKVLRPTTLSSVVFEPHEVSMLVGDTKTLDELRDFSIRITLAGNTQTFDANLSDFAFSQIGGNPTISGISVGDYANTAIHGERVGSTSVHLSYVNAVNAQDFVQEVVVYVRPEAPIGILYFDQAGNELTTLQLANGESKIVIPKYQMSNGGAPVDIPYSDYLDTANFSLLSQGGIACTALQSGGKLQLRVTGNAQGTGNIAISKQTHYTAPGPELDVEATGQLTVSVDGTPGATTYTLSGRVTDADTGLAIAGAAVVMNGQTATADAGGNYSFTGLSNGNYTITASAGGYQTGSVTATINSSNMVANLALTPTGSATAYTVTGKVVNNATGSPIAGATVTMNGSSATTNAAGDYTFTGVANGTYTITATAPGYNSGSTAVTVSGANITAQTIRLTATGSAVTYVVTGKVVNNANGSPIAGAAVSLNGASAATNASGDYTFAGVPDGTYTITASASGFSSGSTSVTVNGANLTAQTIRLNANGGGGGGGGGGGNGGSTTKSYTLTFETNGGSAISSVTKESGTTVQLGTYVPQRTGYSFIGWYSDKALSSKITSVTLSKDTTVYAKWETVVDANRVDHFAYMQGDDKGMFNPDGNITRAATAMMLYRLLVDTSGTTRSFPDVKTGAWYAEAVQVLAGKGIITGYPDGTFHPEQPITRSEFTAMIARFSEVTGGGQTFSDVPVSHWAYMYVTSAASKGWINGYSDGTFHPSSPITRAEAVTITNRMLERAADKSFVDKAQGLKSFPDLAKSYWAYYDIMEAVNGHDYTKSSTGAETWTGLK